jgi:hypothetical protein
MRILFLSFLSLSCLAAGYHRLTGVVTDQTGAPIPDAAVEIDCEDVYWVARLKSDTSGKFASDLLPPGTYAVNIAKGGFASQRLPVTLTDKDGSLKIVLLLSRQSYSVTVESRTSVLDTSSASHQDAFVLDQQTLADLPVRTATS